MRRTFLVTMAVSIAGVAMCQEIGIVLSGTIQDPSGARVPWASVVVSNNETGRTEAAASQADGLFRIQGLMASRYLLRVQGPSGFESYQQVVDLSSDQRLEITLDIHPVVEAIVVSGERPPDHRDREGPKRQRIRVGGNVRKAQLVHHVRAEYPSDAELDRVEGTVLLHAVIDTDGVPSQITTVNTAVDGRLVAAAIDAVKRWRYNPTLLNGQPIKAAATISVTFHLP